MRVIYYTGSKPAGPIVVPGMEPSIGTVQLPEEEVEGVDFSLPLGRILTVASNGVMGDGSSADFTSIQAAVDNANLGDQIRLKNGDRWVEAIDLPAKSDSGWIYILPEDLGFLPDPGVRIRPGTYGEASNFDDSLMPEVICPQVGVSGMDQAFNAETHGGHHYRFVGIKCSLADDIGTGNVIIRVSGNGHHIILDRCYLFGYYGAQLRRAFEMNGAHCAVIDSELSEVIHTGSDAQAIWGHKATGPLLIRNNKLVATGENLMWGGADPPSRDHIPRDVICTHNWFYKPPEWYTREKVDGTHSYSIKNLLELKMGIRHLYEANILENSWADAQSFALNFKAANQSGGFGEFTVVEDLTFRWNLVKNVSSFVTFAGAQEGGDGVYRFAFYQNAGIMVGGHSTFGGASKRGMQFVGSNSNELFVKHNTSDADRNSIVVDVNDPIQGGELKHNIYFPSTYGQGSLQTADEWPDVDREGNIWIDDRDGSGWGADIFVGHPDDVGFVDHENFNYRLAVDSPYKGTVDGKDPGCDIEELMSRVAGVGGA